jgi:hypothetical protein
MPWGSIQIAELDQQQLLAARKAWTGAAFQEHRTAIACCATLRALIEARAPLDLVALAARFPMDEIVHTELCARLAMELGGGTEIIYDPLDLIADATSERSPLLRACELIVRFFCVSEALSIPLLHATWRAARHPLPRAILGCIVRDEAAHGTFGFTFLDWALPQLSAAETAELGPEADRAIGAIRALWTDIERRPASQRCDVDALAFMETDAYLRLAARAMDERVVRPLRARGLVLAELPSIRTVAAPR